MTIHLTNQPQPLYERGIFRRIDQAPNLFTIESIANEIFCRPRDNQCRLLSETDNTGMTLFSKLIRKAEILRGTSLSSSGIDLWNRFYRHLQLIPNFPLELSSIQRSQPSQTQETQSQDISQDQQRRLLNNLQTMQLKYDYIQRLKEWQQSFSVPRCLLNAPPVNIRCLFQDCSLASDSQTINALNNITGEIINGSPQAKRNAEEFLERAICENHVNTATYLLSAGVDVHRSNFTERNFLQPMMNNVTATNIESKIAMLKHLYDKRKPVSEASFDKLIFQLQQFYRIPSCNENVKENHRLLDKALSHLLGDTVSLEGLFPDATRYVGHVFGLRQRRLDPNRLAPNAPTYIGDELEGFHPLNYLRLHLRLFLQKIFEQIRTGGNTERKYIKEFLCELETGWVVSQYYQWQRSIGSLPNHLELKQRFVSEVLIDYILRQIKELPPQSEYVTYVALPNHSIYIAFCKDENSNIVHIRIDNLGAYSTYTNSAGPEPIRYPRYISSISVEDTNLRNYLRMVLKPDAELHYLGNRQEHTIYNLDNTLPRAQQGLEENLQFNDFQTVGNCTHYSFILGACIRLEQPYGSFFLSLSTTLAMARELFLRSASTNSTGPNAVPQDLPPVMPYKIWLRSKLINQYLTLEAQASSISCMESNELRRILDELSRTEGSECYFLVEGAAGMGKTTFTEQLAYQLQSRSNLETVVFYLPLRLLTNYPVPNNFKLVDIVEQLVFSPSLPSYCRSLLTDVIKDPSTIWIVDGLDELVLHQNLEDALEELFKCQRLVVTTRPGCSNERIRDIAQLENPNRRVERHTISDYGISQKQVLIDGYFADQSTNMSNDELEQLARNLKSILSDNSPNPDLRKFCQLPIYLVKICRLLLSGHVEILNERNTAVINEKFILTVQEKAFLRTEGNLSSTKVIKAKYDKAIDHIEKLAFMSLENDRATYFSIAVKNRALPQDTEYKKIIEERLKELGLLQLDPNGGQFIHASSQDHFTARYLIKGLRFGRFNRRFQGIEQFIIEKRGASEFENVFLCAAQILQSQIQHFEGERKQEKLSLLIEFLRIYLPPASNQTSPNLFQTETLSISLINVVMAILGDNSNIETLSRFVQTDINPILKSVFENINFNDSQQQYCLNNLQLLISDHPQLKIALSLNGIIETALNFVEIDNCRHHRINNLWIVDFIHKFGLEVSPEFGLRLIRTINEYTRTHEPFRVLNALRQVRLSESNEQTTTQIIQQTRPFIEAAMSSDLFQNNIENLIGAQFNRNFHENFKSYMGTYIFNQNNIKKFTCFSISYAKHLINKNKINELRDVPIWFNRLFDSYQPLHTHHPSLLLSWESRSRVQRWEPESPGTMLKRLKQSLDGQSENVSALFRPIFEKWDHMIVEKDLNVLFPIGDFYNSSVNFDEFRRFINEVPVASRFYLDRARCSSIQSYIIELAKRSSVSNQNELAGMAANWGLIGDFLADQPMIDLMDRISPDYVDDILTTLLREIRYLPSWYRDRRRRVEQPGQTSTTISVFSGSGLRDKIEGAVHRYVRPHNPSQYDMRRSDRIRARYPWPSNTVPQQQAIPYQPPINASNLPVHQSGFNPDFSYFGYSHTLQQLIRLSSKNPALTRNFLDSAAYTRLMELKDELEGEISYEQIGLDNSQRDQRRENVQTIERLLENLTIE